MNGRAAKTQRRQREGVFVEALLQAHNALHRDDVDACHSVLHGALGVDDAIPPTVAALTPYHRFDSDFRRLCTTLGVQASYVLAGGMTERGTRLISGGDGDLCVAIDGALRAVEGSDTP